VESSTIDLVSAPHIIRYYDDNDTIIIVGRGPVHSGYCSSGLVGNDRGGCLCDNNTDQNTTVPFLF
jgi:hypothetical protein